MLLSVAAGGRYLQKSDGTPVRLKTDAGWLIRNHLSTTQQNTYLDGIVALGFNTTIHMLLCHAGGSSWANVNEPNDLDGTAPLTTPNDFTTANSAYLDKDLDYVRRAKARGLWVMIFCLYQGFGGGNDGWEQACVASTNSGMQAWAASVANKFKNEDNVIWGFVGDHILSSTALTRHQAFVTALRANGAMQLAGAEINAPDDLITDQTGFTYGTNPATSDMQLHSFYGGGPGAVDSSGDGRTYITADQALRNATVMPVVMQEPNYYLLTGQNHIQRDEVRRAQYWAILSGAIAGTNFGHTGRWDAVSGSFTATLTEVASVDQSYRNAFFDSISWHLLKPSGTSTSSPINGAGSYGSLYCGTTLVTTTNTTDDTFIASAMTSDGSQIVAYVPPTGTGATTFGINCSGLSAGNKLAQWVNPTTGARQNALGGASTVNNSLSNQSFTTPGNNGTSTNDWILVIG